LILTGLAGGDNEALAERLVQIERRRTVLEGLEREVSKTAQHVDAVSAQRSRARRAIWSGRPRGYGVAKAGPCASRRPDC
jgi:hypothetical protein